MSSGGGWFGCLFVFSGISITTSTSQSLATDQSQLTGTSSSDLESSEQWRKWAPDLLQWESAEEWGYEDGQAAPDPADPEDGTTVSAEAWWTAQHGFCFFLEGSLKQ